MRTVSHEIVVDTCLFSPLQLQPRALFSHSWNGLAQWFRNHVVSFPELLGKRQFGMVFLGIQLRYDQPLSFFDADILHLDVGVRLLRGGSRVELKTQFFGNQCRAAEMEFLLCPVKIDEPLSLAARPAAFPEPIQDCFAADECSDTTPRRFIPDLVAAIEDDSEPLAVEKEDFFVHRHYGEVADQWSFSEIPCICESAREKLALARHADMSILRQALSDPLRTMDIELQRPYFVFESGTVETRAYDVAGRLAVVHRLWSSQPGQPLHGIVVERF